MDTATLLYVKSGTTYSRAIPYSFLRGVTEPDKLELVGIIHKLLSGTTSRKVRGFLKHIEVTVPPLASASDRRFLSLFILASDKTIAYGAYASQVVNADPKLVSVWLHDVELCREFTLSLVDTHVYREWDDGPNLDTGMYFTAIVKITGTLASPQTFTTNVSPLTTDIWSKSFPAFNGSIHKASVIGVAASYSQFVYCQVGEVTVSGGNLTWQGFASDFGTPADDGFYYVKFTISVQTTT